MPYLIALLLLLTACSQQEKKSQVLTVNIADDPASLDPRVVRSLKDLSIVKQLYDGLTRLNSEGKPELAAAEQIQCSEDGLNYTFSLRAIKWSDGQTLTAYDFEKSWKEVLSPDFATDYAHMLFPIKNALSAKEGKIDLSEVGVKALDDKTLFVTLENPTPYFLELTAFPTLFPVKNELVNGPFLCSNWAHDDTLTLVKNDMYWDKENVSLNQINFTIIADNLTESLLFEKNQIDWLGQPLSSNISADLVGKLKNDGKLHSYPVAGTFWLKFNTKKEPFNDLRVRKALSYAIDRDTIISYILQGNQKSATHILPPTMALSDEVGFEISLEKAKALLQDYGKEVAITLTYAPSERNSKIVQFLADSWHKNLGIVVKLEAIEMKSYRQKVKKGDFQVGTGDWIADFNDPLSFLELFKYTHTGMNETGWHDETFTALCDAAKNENDLEKRNTLLNEAEKILIEEMVVAPLYHYSFDYVKNESLEGIALSPIGSIDFKNAKKR